MRKLIIMRHGKSSWDNSQLSDIERPLKSRGIKEAALVSVELSRIKAVPESIITSPATRARDTAIIVAQHIGFDLKNLQTDPSVYGANADQMLRILSYVTGNPKSIMIFGHNPTFTQLINKLQEDYLDNLPTCGCFGFKLDIDSLEEIVDAKSKKWFEIIPSKLT
jgi:phosphohistidine phosphatase